MTDEEKHILLNDSILRIPTPKQSADSTRLWMKKKKLSPTSLMIARRIGGQDGTKQLLRVLFDSGGSKTMVNKRVIPAGAHVSKMESNAFETIAGTFIANETVQMHALILPEFDSAKEINDNRRSL